MRQELRNLRLAVDKEETRSLLRPPKVDKGPGLGRCLRGELGIEDNHLYTHFSAEKNWKKKWEEEEGKRSDPRQVVDPAAHTLRCVGGGRSRTETLTSGLGSVAMWHEGSYFTSP